MMALHLIPGVGNVLMKQLISYCGSAEGVFKKPKGKLEKIPGIGPSTSRLIVEGEYIEKATKEFEKAKKDKTEILFYTDDNYPARLKTIVNAPALLYYKGNISLDVPRTVGIVGTRHATPYGRSVVEEIIEDLIPYQATIISGLAYGIDIHAHRQSLVNGLNTVGVMASGMDIIYPGSHRETAKEMTSHGGLVTENYFGVKPDAYNFPARNRIIAALSDALIVVEAASRGGALITANISNSYSKDVFAVPGGIDQQYSVGCNELIKDNKAAIFTSVTNMIEMMNWDLENKKIAASATVLKDLSMEEMKVIELFRQKNNPMAIDELIIKSAFSPGEMATLLLSLEFKKLVKVLPGKQFQMT